MSHAVRAHGQADGPFGGDVHGFRTHLTEALPDGALYAQGQSDLRVSRAGDGVEALGRQHAYFVPATRELLHSLFKRADHAIGLRPPRIRCNEYSHGQTL